MSSRLQNKPEGIESSDETATRPGVQVAKGMSPGNMFRRTPGTCLVQVAKGMSSRSEGEMMIPKVVEEKSWRIKISQV
jgi:hypothetical protein